jgi:hypothetical protein
MTQILEHYVVGDPWVIQTIKHSTVGLKISKLSIKLIILNIWPYSPPKNHKKS